MEILEIKDILEVELLLSGFSLPTSDLRSTDKVKLFGAYQNENLIGCIGVELHGSFALLRSLAVNLNNREKGIGKQLVEYVEIFCERKNVKEVFLLTETANQYFEKRGYRQQKREYAPSGIKSTTQFSELCPSSSMFMSKRLDG